MHKGLRGTLSIQTITVGDLSNSVSGHKYHWLPINDVVQEGAEIASEPVVKKDCNKIAPSGHSRAMHFWTHCLHGCFPKSCTRSKQSTFNIDMVGRWGAHQTPSLAENNWQLMATGKINALQGQGSNQVTHATPVHPTPMHIQAAIAELMGL